MTDTLRTLTNMANAIDKPEVARLLSPAEIDKLTELADKIAEALAPLNASDLTSFWAGATTQANLAAASGPAGLVAAMLGASKGAIVDADPRIVLACSILAKRILAGEVPA